MQYKLGDEVMLPTTMGSEKYLVVRIVTDSNTLFEKEDGTRFTVKESYVELRSRDGRVRFISLQEQRFPAEKKTGFIKGLAPYSWKAEVNV